MTTHNPSILGRLRAVVPLRVVRFDEALRVAELQANKLAALLNVSDAELRNDHIAGLPRIVITYADLPVSGTSHWNGQNWVIALASGDSPARQRFTLLHEFKHIADHGHASTLYVGDRNRTAAEQAESAADYFAGCALVSKRRLKAAWGQGMQNTFALADHFSVSEQAIRVRLAQTGLNAIADEVPSARCARPVSTPSHQAQQFRTSHPSYASKRFR